MHQKFSTTIDNYWNLIRPVKPTRILIAVPTMLEIVQQLAKILDPYKIPASTASRSTASGYMTLSPVRTELRFTMSGCAYPPIPRRIVGPEAAAGKWYIILLITVS
jgi:hypothetical protein